MSVAPLAPLACAALVAVVVAVTPGARAFEPVEPRVTFDLVGYRPSSAQIGGDLATFVDGRTAENPHVLVWNLVTAPRELSGRFRYYRNAVRMNRDIAAWHQYGDEGLELAMARLDRPGIDYVVSRGLAPNFEDFDVDGRCVTFSVFDREPSFTISMYRACLGDDGRIRRDEIDGNLVRSDNGNPVATHNGVHAHDGEVVWTAGSFPPFESSPMLYQAAGDKLTRLMPTTAFAQHLNARSLLIGEPVGQIGVSSHIELFDRATRRIVPIVDSRFYVQWHDMNERSEVVYNTDLGEGDNQRTYLFRPGAGIVKVGPAGALASVMTETIIAYAWEDEARVYDLATGRDVRMSKAGVYNESLRASGGAVVWIGFDSELYVSLPVRDAMRALAGVVASEPGVPAPIGRKLRGLLDLARAAAPAHMALANKAMARFVVAVGDALKGARIDEVLADALVAAATRIAGALVDNELGRCADRIDDDGDGDTDCDDGDCEGDGTCIEAFACDDGRDDDGDGLTDCDDGECLTQGPCSETSDECYDGADNDGDGAADCDDSDCGLEPPCVEFGECGDDLDNDDDGLTDCDDGDCTFTDSECYEFVCDDGLDSDHDGLTDCADDACASAFKCQETDCHDGVDNDGDSFTDCFDPTACSVDNGCVESECEDGEDDDGDGLTDCDDESCAPFFACQEQGDARCDDGADDDSDGLTDCAEAECMLALTCAGAPARDLGSALGDVASGDLADETSAYLPVCGSGDGADAEATWTAPADGVYAFDTFGSAFDSILTVSSDEALACNDDAGDGTQSQVIVALVEGETVLVIVHGFGGVVTGAWQLHIVAL